MCPPQGKRSIVGGARRLDGDVLRHRALDDARARRCVGADEARRRLVEIRERRRQSPHAKRRHVSPQPRERELDLHAALGRQELVPFVHDDRLKGGEMRAPFRARQQQRETLGRGDERGRKPGTLAGADGGGCIASARLQRPRNAEIDEGGAERRFGIGGERSERRDPQHPERWRTRAAGRARIVAQPLEERSHPRRVGLAGAGRRLD